MIKFDTINGTLCLMTEPVPLTPEAKFPCVVQFNPSDHRTINFRNRKPFILHNINNEGYVHYELAYAAHYSLFEIIGYPVADGSGGGTADGIGDYDSSAKFTAVPAGEANEPKPLTSDARFDHVEVGNLAIYTNGAGNMITEVDHKNRRFATGTDDWKDEKSYYSMDDGKHLSHKNETDVFTVIDLLFKGYEIKPAKVYEPQQQFKVGDWVEVEETNQDKKTIHHVLIDRMNKLSDGTYNICFKSWYSIVFCHELTHREYDLRNADTKIKYRITRKLSPSDVVVDFGSFKGTIEPSPFRKQITVKDIRGYAIAYINIAYLDTTTRELVEALLKAQEKGDNE